MMVSLVYLEIVGSLLCSTLASIYACFTIAAEPP